LAIRTAICATVKLAVGAFHWRTTFIVIPASIQAFIGAIGTVRTPSSITEFAGAITDKGCWNTLAIAAVPHALVFAGYWCTIGFIRTVGTVAITVTCPGSIDTAAIVAGELTVVAAYWLVFLTGTALLCSTKEVCVVSTGTAITSRRFIGIVPRGACIPIGVCSRIIVDTTVAATIGFIRTVVTIFGTITCP
jgi:hypothetical protein